MFSKLEFNLYMYLLWLHFFPWVKFYFPWFWIWCCISMNLKQRTIRFKPGVKMNYSSLLRSRRRPLCVVAREAGEKEKAETKRYSIIAIFISRIPSGPSGRERLPRRVNYRIFKPRGLNAPLSKQEQVIRYELFDKEPSNHEITSVARFMLSVGGNAWPT